MSNGVSKTIAVSGQDASGMQSIGIPDFSVVKRIKGCQLDGDDRISKLSFSKKDGTLITKIELASGGKPYGPESVVNDDEEIIGMFGDKSSNVITQLGFIVWKPPQF